MKGLAASVLAAGMLLGATEGSAEEGPEQFKGRRLGDRLSAHELRVQGDALIAHERSRSNGTPELFQVPQADIKRANSVVTNDTNGYFFSADDMSGELFNSIVVTTVKGAAPPEGSVEIQVPYHGPTPDIKKLDYRFYLSPGTYSQKRVVLAKLFVDDGFERKVQKQAPPKSGAFYNESTEARGAPRHDSLNLSIGTAPLESRFLLPVYRTPRFQRHELKTETHTSAAFDMEFSSVLKGTAKGRLTDVGTAFATNVLLHELGHDIVADHVGATGSSLGFLTSKDGQFFMASSHVDTIDNDKRLAYNMGGEWAADMTFEYALESYRNDPNLYNKSLMFFSGTDLLWYSIYAFYLSDGHEELDPIAITRNNNISEETVLSVAIAKTVINAYRVYSGSDKVIPYFSVDNDAVTLNFKVTF